MRRLWKDDNGLREHAANLHTRSLTVGHVFVIVVYVTMYVVMYYHAASQLSTGDESSGSLTSGTISPLIGRPGPIPTSRAAVSTKSTMDVSVVASAFTPQAIKNHFSLTNKHSESAFILTGQRERRRKPSVRSYAAMPERFYTGKLAEPRFKVSQAMQAAATSAPNSIDSLLRMKGMAALHVTTGSIPPAFPEENPLTLRDLMLPTFAKFLHPFTSEVIDAHQKLTSQGKSGKMLIVIPFREHQFGKKIVDPITNATIFRQERSEQLVLFIHHMDAHLRAVGKLPGRDYALLVIEQENYDVAFNKGALFNAAAHVARKWGYDYFVAHDVDIFPISLLNKYDLADDGLPVHYCTGLPARENKGFIPAGHHFGGVFASGVDDFFKSKGFPNDIWGWGAEDNIIQGRIQRGVGFHRIPTAVGAYDQLDHSTPVKRGQGPLAQANTARRVIHISNGANKILTTEGDGIDFLNATVTRYAPMPNLGAFHWVTVSLDSMHYRPNTNG